MQPQFEADAAEIVALDDRGLEAELRRADRGDIAARARADDDDVETGVGHRVPFVSIAICLLYMVHQLGHGNGFVGPVFMCMMAMLAPSYPTRP